MTTTTAAAEAADTAVAVADSNQIKLPITRVAELVLPGIRIRRGLFFRYTLVWQAPETPRS